jgi:hypothetical protein
VCPPVFAYGSTVRVAPGASSIVVS